MIDIKENQKLDIDNVLSYRGKVRQAELEGIGKEMEIYIQKSGAERAGSPATATYGVEGDEIDIEFLMPIEMNNSEVYYIFSYWWFYVMK